MWRFRNAFSGTRSFRTNTALAPPSNKIFTGLSLTRPRQVLSGPKAEMPSDEMWLQVTGGMSLYSFGSSAAVTSSALAAGVG